MDVQPICRGVAGADLITLWMHLRRPYGVHILLYLTLASHFCL